VKLVWSRKFTRSVRKLARRNPGLLDLLESALKRLEIDPHDPKLRSHALSGDLEGCWACSAGYDLRIVFEFYEAKTISGEGNSPSKRWNSRRGLLTALVGRDEPHDFAGDPLRFPRNPRDLNF
jgi:addiction module RelE/StbE family toxin